MRPTVCRVLFGYRVQEQEADLLLEVCPKVVSVGIGVHAHD